jgi:hypothetical protein
MLRMDSKVMYEILEYNAKRWWARILRFYPSAGEMPKLRISNRLGVTRSTNASPRYAQAEFFKDGTRGGDCITMSAKWMLAKPDVFPDNVIPHELAHIVAWRIYKDPGHGKGWQTVINSVGIKTAQYIDHV